MKHRYLFGLLIGLVCSCLYLFYLIYAEIKEKTIADFNSSQLIHAMQAGRGIEKYFGDLTTFLEKAAGESHIIDLDDHGKNEFDFALKTGGHGIKAITRVDEKGRITYTLPYDSAAIGRDISYQKHVREIMNTKKPVVSDVFTAVQGYNAVALHVPVFNGKKFRGTLAFLIDFQTISKRFLEDIRIGETGYAWMMSREGVELYCPVPGHTGKSVFENVKEFPSIISMAKDMLKGSRGTAVYDFNQIREKKIEAVKKHAVYMPVGIGSTFWTIVVATSEDEILAPLENFRNKLIFVIGLLLLGCAVFSFYGMRARGIILEEAKRKKIEEELRESEERYRDLVENASDLICTHDLKGTLLSVNKAAERATGFSAKELVGMRIPDILPKNRRHEFDDYIRAVQRDGKAAGIMKVITREGEERFWEYRNTLRTEGVPEPVVRGMARDVTPEVLARRALKKSEEKYRLLFENASDVIFSYDREFRILSVSPSLKRILGYEPEDFTGKSFQDLGILPPEYMETAFANATRLLSGERVDSSIYEFIAKDGTRKFIESSGTPIFRNGKVESVTSIARDITERKRLEEEMLKADKLESVGILAGGIAHDFNNILAAIVGNISLALRHVKPGSRIFDLLISAETASMKARGLTGQLLTFARGGAPVKETASVSKLIRESSFFVLQGSKSGCEFSIAEDLWPVEADMGQISQVISNIVINANQAMPEGGIIRIAADNVTLDEEHGIKVTPGRYIRISVKDQGAGIPEKHRSKIFDPYFSTKQTGSGLGLATAYSIIKKHNGHISVDSILGAGTVFHIYLPASAKAVPEKEEAALLKGEGKILLMDDDRMLREIAGEMLETLGYEAEFAENGAQALEMHRKAKESGKPYDAVILDLTIPGSMGGKDAVKGLLEIDPELKAIVCSGYSDDPVMSNHHEYGFKGMMAKPFDIKTLGRVLYDVIKGERREVKGMRREARGVR